MKINWQEVLFIAVFGAIGGLLAWLTGLTVAGDSSNAVALSTALLGGAIAAGVGVYLLASSDTAQLARCLFFAALCGISWKPVLQAGSNLLEQSALKRDVEVTKAATQDLSDASKAPNEADIRKLATSASKVAAQLPKIQDLTLRQQARSSLLDAVSTLQAHAMSKPHIVTEALSDIGKSASESGSLGVKNAAVTTLQGIQQNDKIDPASRDFAERAAQSFRN